jgi:hypothetical protein
VGDDFRKFCDYLETESMLQYPRVHFTIDELIEIKHTSNSSYKAIQALMRTTVKEDLLTGNPLDGELEDHHIFPYSLNKSGLSKGRLNSIVNKVLVSKNTNRTISNTNPDQYLVEVAGVNREHGTTSDFDRRLKTCFIPYSSAESDFENRFAKNMFNHFLNDRAEMLIARIREVVGDSWQVAASGEVNLEDDEFVTT